MFIWTALALLLTAASLWRFRQFFDDDAFITLRYARNVIEGNGPVWNPGERVEGYTSFLHLMLVSLIASAGIPLVTAARVVGVASLVGLFGYVAFYMARLRRWGDAPQAWLLPSFAITLLACPIVAWAWGGLETTLFCLCATIALFEFCALLGGHQRPAVVGLLFGLAALVRPEGMFLTAISGALLLFQAVRRQRSLGDVVAFGAGFLLLFAPLLLWRFSYYGSWVPNTFYAKTALSVPKVLAGVRYIKGFVFAPPYAVIVALVLWLVAAARRELDIVTLYLTGVLLTYAAYVATVGGDFMPAFRFMMPMLPTLGLLICLVGAKYSWPTSRPGSRIAGVTAALLLALQFVVPTPAIRAAETLDPPAVWGRAVGRFIDTNWPNGSLIALHTAGTTPFYAPRNTYIDMLGLNDVTIARRSPVPHRAPMQSLPGHEKGDGNYVLARRPDYIIAGPAEGAPVTDPWFLSDVEMAENPLINDYELHQTRLSANDGSGRTFEFTYYQRREPQRQNSSKQ